MGAALTQHPEAMRAVVSRVGIYDALRWETQPNGEFNVTEFGSTRDPDQFRALLDYSPLMRVRDGVKYPAVLLATGDNDGRVASRESRKFAAKLQTSTGSGNPVLLRTEAEAGHGPYQHRGCIGGRRRERGRGVGGDLESGSFVADRQA